jgi:hypothetical protein
MPLERITREAAKRKRRKQGTGIRNRENKRPRLLPFNCREIHE